MAQKTFFWNYGQLLRDAVPLLDSLEVRKIIRLQQDGTASHNARTILKYLNKIFLAEQITRGGAHKLPPHSVEVRSLNFSCGNISKNATPSVNDQ